MADPSAVASSSAAARESLLRRLRAAPRKPQQNPAWRQKRTADRESQWLALQPPIEALDVRFVSEAEAVGTQVLNVPNWQALPEMLAPWLKEYGVRSALSADLEKLAPLRQHLVQALGIDVERYNRPVEDIADSIYQRHCALTIADEGLADSGSLIFRSRPEQPRLLSLALPLHVAILEKTRLHAGLAAYLNASSFAQNPPSNLVLISGASRTGDIELKLSVGVHGPKTLLIALIDG